MAPAQTSPRLASGPVTFFFDPVCPWTWVTSRWLVAAADERGLDITWRPYSLLLKNGDQIPEERRSEVEASHRALRVISRLAAEEGNGAVGAFYEERGHQKFTDGDPEPESAKVLSAIGMDPALAEVEEDESLDAAISESMDAAHAAAGSGSGSPILAVGDKGFFGPVLTDVPSDPGSLWDQLMGLWDIPELHELKRDRESDPAAPPRPD